MQNKSFRLRYRNEVSKLQSTEVWDDEWNKIIREVIFADEELKTLMKLPEDIDIITFIDKYFIRAGYTSKVLEDEHVRVIYAEMQGSGTNVKNVMRKMVTFDIYVKLEDLHNVGNDRLVMRTKEIANRQLKLLTSERVVQETGYRFSIAGNWDGGTRTIGYGRYTQALYYMQVY